MLKAIHVNQDLLVLSSNEIGLRYRNTKYATGKVNYIKAKHFSIYILKVNLWPI